MTTNTTIQGTPQGIQMMTPARKRRADHEDTRSTTSSQMLFSPGNASNSSGTPLTDRDIRLMKRENAKLNGELGQTAKKLQTASDHEHALQQQVFTQGIEIADTQTIARSNRISALRGARTHLEKDLAQISERCTDLLNRLIHVQEHTDQVAPLRNAVTQLQQVITQKQIAIQTLNLALPGDDATPQEKLTALENQEVEIEDLQGEATALLPQLNDLKNRIIALEKSNGISILKNERTHLEQRLTQISEECTELLDRLTHVQGRQGQVTDLRTAVTELKTLITQQQTAIQTLNLGLPAEGATPQERLDALSNQRPEITGHLNEITITRQPQLNDLKNQITALEALPRERTWQDTLYDAARIGSGLLIGGGVAAFGAYAQYKQYTGGLD